MSVPSMPRATPPEEPPRAEPEGIRVLIVAAYASARAGLHALLADAEECVILGAVSGSAELERLLPEARPDVVLVDENEADAPSVLALIAGSEAGMVLMSDDRA